MKLVRYLNAGGDPRVGVVVDESVHDLPVYDMAALLGHTLAEIRELVESAAATAPVATLAEVSLLVPIDGRTEVWGAGVTYLRSRKARQEESRHDLVYTEVYDAERPELFFKAPAWRVRTDGEAGGLRADCADTVAEPELALVLNQHGETIGALVCNDMTARGIEAENPIYLPQAKVYDGSTILSTAIVPWWTITDPEDLLVTIEVRRDDEIAFQGSASTASMKRGYAELVGFLFRGQGFPDGAVLSTGTGIVPELGDGLRPGDVVRVSVDQVGTLTNVMEGLAS
ncbi:MAG TPA: fumarylacetoacetate hydrolase family protein [Actinokineospora sp.]|nr:fumarylacetoacetate hydrolase family protein [Actinokineospora sp.]